VLELNQVAEQSLLPGEELQSIQGELLQVQQLLRAAEQRADAADEKQAQNLAREAALEAALEAAEIEFRTRSRGFELDFLARTVTISEKMRLHALQVLARAVMRCRHMPLLFASVVHWRIRWLCDKLEMKSLQSGQPPVCGILQQQAGKWRIQVTRS
jgi:hypothetical protein